MKTIITLNLKVEKEEGKEGGEYNPEKNCDIWQYRKPQEKFDAMSIYPVCRCAWSL